MGNYPKGSVWASGRVAGGGKNSEVGAEAQAEDQAATTRTYLEIEWCSLSDGGSAINGATPFSFGTCEYVCILFLKKVSYKIK